MIATVVAQRDLTARELRGEQCSTPDGIDDRDGHRRSRTGPTARGVLNA